MGNASSTEQQQQQQQQQSNVHTLLNPLARPRSHAGASGTSNRASSSSSSSSSTQHPLTQTSSAHGRSSPSWTRHGSLRRGSSQAPASSSSSTQQIRNAFFRDTSTPSSAATFNAGGSGGSGNSGAATSSLGSLRRNSGRRSRSGSVNLALQTQTMPNTPNRRSAAGSKADGGADDPTTPTAREPRERSVTLGSTSLDSRYRTSGNGGGASSPSPTRGKDSSGSLAAAAPDTLQARAPLPPSSLGSSMFRRGSRAQSKNIDLQDVQDDVHNNESAPTTSHPAWNASLVSPYPSPSIATSSRHASGTTTYSNTDAAGKAASPQTVPPPSGHASASSSNRPFGRGVAAIFSTTGHSLGSTAAASMTNSSFSPTTLDSSDDNREEGTSSTEPSSPRGSGFTRKSGNGGGGAPSNTSASNPPMDALGRQVAAAFPSYLKIPTLIPSKEEQPLQPTLSLPASPTGSGPGSGNVTPGSSGWSGVAATAARATSAVLTPEDVVIAPGDASRVSSPSSEELPAVVAKTSADAKQDGVEPVIPIETGAPRDGTDEITEAKMDADDKRKSTETVHPRTHSASLSRTPTPTQKSHHAAKALTPARLDDQPKTRTRAPSTDTETSSERFRRVHVATGVASGATTPVMPIPPGLTSAPPSAVSPAAASADYTAPTDSLTSSDLKVDIEAAAAVAATGTTATPHTPTAKTPTDSPASATTPATTPKVRHPPHLTPYYYRDAKGPISLMPIVITWRGGGKEVFVTGTFANEWRSKILLKRSSGQSSGSGATATAGAVRRANASKEEHTVVLHLPPGTHRMKFIVDDRWRVSRELPTASDGDGNLVNYLEIPNVGPAHPGPLSAPGEDLIDGKERRREREVEKIKEAERAARKRPSSRGAVEGDATSQADQQQQQQVETSGTATTAAVAPLPQQEATDQAKIIEAARRKAVLDLREEARRAEALKSGQLEEVFGIDDEALRAAETWVQEVPDSVVKAHYAEEQYQDELDRNGGHHHQRSHSNYHQPPPPPSLPRQLEKVILNSSPANPALAPPGGTVDDNSILPAPNHVVLNHLTASAIKGGVLAVGTTTRYKRKYVTTVFYKPVQT